MHYTVVWILYLSSMLILAHIPILPEDIGHRITLISVQVKGIFEPMKVTFKGEYLRISSELTFIKFVVVAGFV